MAVVMAPVENTEEAVEKEPEPVATPADLDLRLPVLPPELIDSYNTAPDGVLAGRALAVGDRAARLCAGDWRRVGVRRRLRGRDLGTLDRPERPGVGGPEGCVEYFECRGRGSDRKGPRVH